FFQAEDGIRDFHVTGVQTCALPIYAAEPEQADDAARSFRAGHIIADDAPVTVADGLKVPLKELTWHFVSRHVTDILTASEEEIRSEERRVGKEWSCRWATCP